MKDKDIAVLLQKADELKALFTLGQRVIPFLEEIFVFVRDIQPLLDDINKSVAENLKKMPGASEQLSKVNEANELATNEIMDVVDGLVFKVDIIAENVNNITSNGDKHLGNAVKLLEILYKAIEQNSNLKAILPQLSSSIQTLKNSTKSTKEIVNNNSDILESIRNDSNSIMMSLQVQDITSQQLAAVNHMLVTVQHKLGDILKHFQSSDLSSMMAGDINTHNDKINVTKMHREIAFDPIAIESLNNNVARQENVDELILQHFSNEDANDNELLNNDDIDSMFGNNNLEINNTIETSITENDEIVANNSEIVDELDETFNNSDIDSFIDNNVINEVSTPIDESNSKLNEFDIKIANLESIGDDLEAFSQDDIDALFG